MSSSPGFVAFDIETTGLVAGVDRVVEVAAVRFRDGEVLETFEAFVDPGIPVPEEAVRVSGITDEMLRGSPPIAEALPPFLAFLCTGIPVAHNAPFDVSFLCADIDTLALPPPPGPVLDTRGLAKHAFPGRMSYSLANLARDLRVQVDGAHRALADAQTCRHVFGICVAALTTEGRVLTQADLVRMSGDPLDFAAHAPVQQKTAALLERARILGAEVEIDYKGSTGEPTTRRIKPLAFTRVGSRIAVAAWCSLRDARRTFVIESITAVRPAPGPAPAAPPAP